MRSLAQAYIALVRKLLEAVTGLLILYGAIGLGLAIATGGRVNILPGPLVEWPTEQPPRGYSND